MKLEHLQVKNFNFVGLNSQTEGDISFFGKTYFFGTHTGTITQEDSETISMHEESEISGNLIASYANVFGKVKGDILAHEKVELFSGSEVRGNIKSKNIQIHPGATVYGELETLV